MTTTTHAAAPASVGFAGRIVAVLRDVIDSFVKAQAFRRTYAELSSLTDRELDDLGLTRGAVSRAAHDSVYGR